MEDKKVTKQEIREWIIASSGDWFHLDDIKKQLNISSEAYGNLSKAIHDLCTENICKARGGRTGQYRKIDNSLNYVDWLNSIKDDTYKHFRWPKGRDGTGFGFDGFAAIYPNEIIAIAGVSNQCKTGLVLNILVENMDLFPCRLMGNEIYPNRFSNRMSHFDWVTLIDEQAKPKFEVIRVVDNNYEDKIRPGALNLIDWLRPPPNYWEIGNVAVGIQSKLEGGIAVIVTQKSEDKRFGRGGDSLKDVSSIYLTIDPMGKGSRKLTVEKIKDAGSKVFDGKLYHFDIEDYGSKFMDIYEVKKCSVCHGFEHKMGKKCIACDGTGFTRVEPKIQDEELPF